MTSDDEFPTFHGTLPLVGLWQIMSVAGEPPTPLPDWTQFGHPDWSWFGATSRIQEIIGPTAAGRAYVTLNTSAMDLHGRHRRE